MCLRQKKNNKKKNFVVAFYANILKKVTKGDIKNSFLK